MMITVTYIKYLSSCQLHKMINENIRYKKLQKINKNISKREIKDMGSE